MPSLSDAKVERSYSNYRSREIGLWSNTNRSGIWREPTGKAQIEVVFQQSAQDAPQTCRFGLNPASKSARRLRLLFPREAARRSVWETRKTVCWDMRVHLGVLRPNFMTLAEGLTREAPACGILTSPRWKYD
jgi:hypothetical protein